MGKVFLDISMSLDGYVAGLHDSLDSGLGEGGIRLHEWIWGASAPGSIMGEGLTKADKEAFDQIFGELLERTGAIVTGRRTYELSKGWGGSHPVNGAPVFVLSKDVPKRIPKGKSTFTFVSDGIASAVRQARSAAGDRDVYVMGGANVAQQSLTAGLLDEIRIHLVPVLLGAGIRLFDHLESISQVLQKVATIDAPLATHFAFRVVK